jgi:hypothetical protein
VDNIVVSVLYLGPTSNVSMQKDENDVGMDPNMSWRPLMPPSIVLSTKKRLERKIKHGDACVCCHTASTGDIV